MSQTKIINLFGSAGAGKSTQAMGLVPLLRLAGYSAEYVSEYAKDVVFSKCEHLLTQNQLYVFSEQFRRLKVLDDSNLDFIIPY